MDKKLQAQHLYMTQGMSQKQIAQIVGVSERTIYTWIHQNAWEQLRRAAYQAPAMVADNFYSQIVEMQNLIAGREPGARFATPQEAEVMRKLLVCIEKTKKATSVTQSMQVLESFKNFTRNKDPKFTKTFANYTEEFLTGKAVNNYAPFDLEYGVDNVLPTMPFYEEPEAEVAPAEVLCHADGKICHHPGKCTYPRCTVSRAGYAPSQDSLVPYVPAATPERTKESYLNYMKASGFTFDQETQKHSQSPEEIGSTAEEVAGKIEDNDNPQDSVTEQQNTLATKDMPLLNTDLPSSEGEEKHTPSPEENGSTTEDIAA